MKTLILTTKNPKKLYKVFKNRGHFMYENATLCNVILSCMKLQSYTRNDSEFSSINYFLY